MMNTEYTEADPVILDYSQLLGEEDLAAKIEEAFGFNGLGLLLVRGIPGYTDLRQNLLPLAYKFAHLPEEVKEKYVHAESYYSVGWSHGKEMMTKGVPDFSKGSYYNNPIEDRPFDSEELIRKYPSFCQPNIWPEEELPQLSVAFKDLGRLIVQVGGKLASHLDKFVSQDHKGFSRIEDVVSKSRTIKARLLYYFPRSQEDINNPAGDWCGWHNDHCTLTGLTSAIYFDENGNQVKNPDPKSGLFVKTRSGILKRVSIPADHLAFQIGETSQIHSGGKLIATPHAVIAPKVPNVSRGTLAVFMEPMWDYPMNQPEGINKEDVLKGSVNLPVGVPVLSSRWDQSMDFGKFTEETFASYYNY